jgi:hypothetical protein
VKKKRNTGMFEPYWTDLDGNRLGPFKGREVWEAHRIWREHSDIRLGLFQAGEEDAEVDIAELFGLAG